LEARHGTHVCEHGMRMRALQHTAPQQILNVRPCNRPVPAGAVIENLSLRRRLPGRARRPAHLHAALGPAGQLLGAALLLLVAAGGLWQVRLQQAQQLARLLRARPAPSVGRRAGPQAQRALIPVLAELPLGLSSLRCTAQISHYLLGRQAGMRV